MPASAAFVAAVVWITFPFGNVFGPIVAVYLLSFWHYYFYFLAYCCSTVSLKVFKRDAIAMKTVSLGALGAAYFAAPPDILSLAVVAGGFLLNIAAARALGPDRTYYGHELAGLPPRRISAFPYSWIAHPMLLGNVAAFSGTLINDGFRAQWWPLACLHVVMNLGLLVMETAVAPRPFVERRSLPQAADRRERAWSIPRAAVFAVAGAAAGWAFLSRGPWNIGAASGAGLGASVSLYAYVIYACYTSPRIPSIPIHRGAAEQVQAERSR